MSVAEPFLQNTLMRRRQELGLTQEELAARTGVSRQTINAIERGRYEPRLRLAFRLADQLSCRVDELFSPAPTAEERHPHR